MKLKKLLQGLAFALPLAAAGTAHSVLINDTGDDFVVSFNQMQGTNQLSALASFDVISVDLATGQIQINVSILNSSVLTTFTNAGITSFGLQTNPQVTGSYIIAGSTFEGIDNDDIPSQSFINLCIFADNSCNGGSQGDLLAVGDSDAFRIQLTGTFPNGLDVIASAIKFQTSGGSFEFPGSLVPCQSPTQPGCTPVQVVPEPAPLALLGLGLIGGLLLRRRRA